MRTSGTMQRGSVLLVALCLTIVLGVAVAGYFAVCARTMEMSNRSFCYTSSTQLAETGLEEALWSLNQARNTPSYNWPDWTIANNVATKQLTGFATNRGVAGVVDIRVEDFGSANPTVTAHGVSQMADGTAIDKELKIKAQPGALFSNAVGAYDWISFTNSYAATLDSYDSSQADYAPSTATDQAIVSAAKVTVGAANIQGYIAVKGSTPTYSSPSTGRGLRSGRGRRSVAPTSQDLSRVLANGNQQNLFDIVADLPGVPGAFSLVLSPDKLTRYYVTDLLLANGDRLTIDGPVILVVSGDLIIQNTGSIVVTANGSAQIVVSGKIDLGGRGIDNQTKIPANLALFRRGSLGASFNRDGSPYTAIVGTPVPFHGVIYDPYGSLVVQGNSAVYGSLVAKMVTVGHEDIHYDLALRRATFSALNMSFDIAQWIAN